MIDYKAEVEGIRTGARQGMFTEFAVEKVIDLCRRVAADALEDAAKVNETLASQLTYATSEHWRRKAAYGITAADIETAARLALTGAAAAIRTRKEQEGR